MVMFHANRGSRWPTISHTRSTRARQPVTSFTGSHRMGPALEEQHLDLGTFT
jgi:hypothetical protein